MDHGLRELINTADSLGNTPLHHLIVRYALEERRYGYNDDHQPWNKWDMLHIVRFLLQNGARPSINQGRNSALACVLRYSTMCDFHNFGLNFAGQMHCLPQRLKSTLFEIFSNGGCPKGTRSVEKISNNVDFRL